MTLSETLDDVLTSIEAFLVGVADVIFSIGSKSPNYSSGIPELFLQLSSHNFLKKISVQVLLFEFDFIQFY